MFSFLRRWFPKPLSPAEQHVIDTLQAKGRLFGSRKWGGFTESSDYDYCIDYNTYRYIASHLDTCKLSYSYAYSYRDVIAIDFHIKFTLSDGTSYDVLGYTPNTPFIEYFSQTCDILDAYSASYPLIDKKQRHAAFEIAWKSVRGEPVTLFPFFSQWVHAHFPEFFI